MRAHTLYYMHKLPAVIKLSRQSQTIILSLTVCMSTRYARKPDGLTIFFVFLQISHFSTSVIRIYLDSGVLALRTDWL